MAVCCRDVKRLDIFGCVQVPSAPAWTTGWTSGALAGLLGAGQDENSFEIQQCISGGYHRILLLFIVKMKQLISE